MPRAFLSDAREDSGAVGALDEPRRLLTLQDWRDQNDVASGRPWLTVARHAIERGNAVVLICSVRVASSQLGQMDWTAVVPLNKPPGPSLVEITWLPPTRRSIHAIKACRAPDAAIRIRPVLLYCRRHRGHACGRPPEFDPGAPAYGGLGPFRTRGAQRAARRLSGRPSRESGKTDQSGQLQVVMREAEQQQVGFPGRVGGYERYAAFGSETMIFVPARAI